MSLDIVLASGSESRRRLLESAGVEAAAVRPNVDEDAMKAGLRAEGVSVRDQAMRLAELKSAKVSQRQPGLVIGGDQMLALGDEAFDKPKDLDGARDHLRKLSGKAHTLETAIVVCENGQPVWRHLARPRLTMRSLSEEFIEDYVDKVGEPLLSTVGAYQLEGLGAQLFNKIEGDYFSILGLPLLPLLDYLRIRGVLKT
ncbi:putative maf protein [Hyphomonas adhaerens MHS-3]|uniref:Nucleoside triphosphate pyrophosphatase n=1 Tax=Hyphomonas adhaerens MHS-3 TaxID=1280949 RepID=A0A069E8X1_9PROT|nr:Maf family protein [Hyphomonas adhaerens]KCZ84871.1 putative maf protein [Hyphomonas adhaerens MHS-3]